MERIAHFEIGAPLGRGGYASVHRARDTKLDREVALKRLLPEIADDAEALYRISEEARAIARLSHPGIVRLFDVLRHGQEVVLVMELVPGPTLQQRLADGPLDARLAARLGAEVAVALAHAHERGIIHRDLKPSNLILEPGGRIKVMDFGLVRFLSAVPLLDTADASSLAVGTPPYMSPEQVRGLPVDQRSDIFSLGVVLFELVGGRRPFRGPSFAELARAILYREPDWDGAQLGSGLAAVLARALAKEPWERYQDMRSMAADLTLVARPGAGTVAATRREPAIVGRRSELAWLESELDRVLAPGGRGRVVVVTGEAGVGKTALVTELLQRTAVTRRVPHSLSGFHEGDRGHAVLLRAIAPIVAMFDARAKAVALSIDRPIRETLEVAFVILARAGSFLWVIESLHDAGVDALAALRAIIEAMPRTRGLLILTYRSEERVASDQDRLRELLAETSSLSTTLTLPRFGANETRSLLARMLDPRQPPDERLLEHVQRESEGVPLFIRETVLYLRQSGRVTAEGILDLRVGSMRLPDRIRHVLARRIEGVPAELLRTLRAAAMVGEVFDAATVAQVLDSSLEQVDADLVRLERHHELLQPDGSRFRFAHAKIREVVVDALSAEARIALHARLGETLRGDPAASVAEVARHLVEAGLREDAVPYLVAAARAAGRQAANEEARTLYAQVAEAVVTTGIDRTVEHLEMLLELGCLEKIAGQQSSARDTFARVAELAGDSGRLRGTALHHLGCALLPAGDLAGARTHFERARSCFESADDRLWVAGCHDMLGVVARHSGDLSGALRETRRALAIRIAAGNRWGQALSQSNLGAIYYSSGRYRRALVCFGLSVEILESERLGLDTRQRLAQGLDNVGVAACELGLLERALAAEGRALAIERDIADRETEANSLVNLAVVHATLGLTESAADGFQRAARLAMAVSSRVARTEALRGLGSLRLREGRLEEAELLLEEALSVATTTGSSEMRGLAWLELAAAAIARGRTDDAWGFATKVAGVAVPGKVERLAPALLYLRARIHRAGGELREARAALEKLSLESAARCRPELMWPVRRELAELAPDTAVGRAASRRHWAAARRIVRRVAHGIRDPRLRRAYLADRERAIVLEHRGRG